MRTLGPDDVSRIGAGPSSLELVRRGSNGGLFECWETPGEICARPRPSPSLRSPGRATEAPVIVCVDERRAWGGAGQLLSIPAEEIHRVELYGFGGRDHVRVYTRRFMVRNSRAEGRSLMPVDPMMGPPC